MPFPSPRCGTCSIRRIKCDAVHPICGQCMKSSRSCIYADPDSSFLPFRNENIYAGGVARRPRRGKGRKRIETKSTSPKSHNLPAVEAVSPHSAPASLVTDYDWCSILRRGLIHRTRRHPSPPTPAASKPSIEIQAFNFYIRRYLDISEPSITSNAHLNSIHLDCNVVHPRSALELAVSALSLAIFARTKGISDALPASHKRYIEALSKTRFMVQDSERSSSDHLLLTVMLLITYENATGISEAHMLESESWPHHDGAFAMLKARKSSPNRTPRSMLIDRSVRHSLIKFAVLRGFTVPEHVRYGAEFGESGHELELDTCMVQVADLRSKALAMWKDLRSLALVGTHTFRADAQVLLDLVNRLDNRLVAWSANLPESWSYSIISRKDFSPSQGQSAQDAMFFSDTVHTYPNIGTAVLWNRVRACRLITLNIISKLKYHNIAPLEHESNPFFTSIDAENVPDEAQATIDQLVNDICASIPYTLSVVRTPEDVEKTPNECVPTLHAVEDISGRRASLLCFPLSIAIHSPRIDTRHKRWLSEQLLLVSRITGSSVLEKVAKRNLGEIYQDHV